MLLTTFARWCAVPCLALMLISPAGGQDALSSGNALDNRQVTGGRGNARVRSSMVDFRARNLIVTGNVAGGRGFRESVGYSAAGDFGGATGSDDLFGFRAFSALSNPLSTGGRSFDRTLGATMGILEYRRTATASTSAFSVLGRDADASDQYRGVIDSQLRVDRAAARMTDELNRRSMASTLGAARGRDQTYVIESLPLRGVSAHDASRLQLVTGLPTYDRLRVLEDIDAGMLDAEDVRRPYATSLAAVASPSGLMEDDAAPGERVETLDRTGYNAMLNRVRGRFDDEVELDATYQALRDRLAERTREPQSAPTGPEDEKPTRTDRPREIDTGIPDPLQSDPDRNRGTDDLDDEEDDDPRMREMTDDQRARLQALTEALLAGGTIDTLSQHSEDRFAELMRRAEQALKDGEFFFAERRFNRALQLKPDHPLASAGLGHAQLGAGMLLSAALTLENLMREHPEMIAVDYAEGLIPTAERLAVVVNMIDRRMQVEADPRPYALLLAYVGRQLKDRSLVERGLHRMRESASESADDDLLLEVLQKAWLADQTAEDAAASENDAADDGSDG